MSYRIEDGVPSAERFCYLRRAAGLSPKSMEAAQKGLPNTVIGVIALDENDKVAGMGRVVGDGGCDFHIVDMAVLPDYQRLGLGNHILKRIMERIDEMAPDTAYTSLMSDVPVVYKKFGFKRFTPQTLGMYKRKG